MYFLGTEVMCVCKVNRKICNFIKVMRMLNVKHDSCTGELLSFDVVVITIAFRADIQRTQRDMFGYVAWRQSEASSLIIVQQGATYSVYYISVDVIIVHQAATYSVYYISVAVIIVQQDATYSVYYISVDVIIVQQDATYSVYYTFC